MTRRIITRAEWGAKHGQGKVTSGAKGIMVVHHDGHDRSHENMTEAQEAALLRFYEDFHVNGDKGIPNGGLTGTNPRIAYSFIVMQSGRIYEGCGWGRIGAHTENMNSSAYATFFPLNGAKTVPTPEAIAAFQWLRSEGVRLGHLTAHHVVKGHQDYNKPGCPGKYVYQAAVLGCAPINPDSVVPVSVVNTRPSLRLGKGGKMRPAEEREAVYTLQTLLVKTGHLQSNLPTGGSSLTGFFGEVTEAAVKKFQTANGLKADGIVGAATWDKLL